MHQQLSSNNNHTDQDVTIPPPGAYALRGYECQQQTQLHYGQEANAIDVIQNARRIPHQPEDPHWAPEFYIEKGRSQIIIVYITFFSYTKHVQLL